jgi:valyl-tRNA synthetase
MDFRFWRKKKSEEQDTSSEKEAKVEYIKEIISLRNQLSEKEKELNEYVTSKNCGYEFSRSFGIIEKYLTDLRNRPSVRLLEHANIEFIEDKNILTEKVVSHVLEGIELFIPLGELVDMSKELERLTKELESVESEIKRANGKLSNKGFLDKAPKSLVDGEKAKLNKYIDMREKLIAQINDLKG